MTTQTVTTQSEGTTTNRFPRMAAMTCGVAAYALFFRTLCYAMFFVGDVLAPKTIDSGQPGPFWPSVAINAALLALFAAQHEFRRGRRPCGGSSHAGHEDGR